MRQAATDCAERARRFTPTAIDPVVDQICQSTNYQRCKWFDSAFDPEGSVSGRSVIEVRLSELALLTRYEFFTAVDVEKRDPVSWTVQKQRQDGV